MDRNTEMLLCPVKVVKHYLSRTVQYYPVCSNIFISTERRKHYVTKDTVSIWLRSVIYEAYRSASDSNFTAVKVQACGVRNIGASVLFRKTFIVQQVMKTKTCASQTILTSFYLRDITSWSMDTSTRGPVMAAQQVL